MPDLATIDDAELVAPALVAALGIGVADERAPKARLIDFLRRKEVLLLLDNGRVMAGRVVLAALAEGGDRELQELFYTGMGGHSQGKVSQTGPWWAKQGGSSLQVEGAPFSEMDAGALMARTA